MCVVRLPITVSYFPGIKVSRMKPGRDGREDNEKRVQRC